MVQTEHALGVAELLALGNRQLYPFTYSTARSQKRSRLSTVREQLLDVGIF